MFLVTYAQFAVQPAKFPVPILREFGGNTLNLFANARASRITSLKRQISLYFPAKEADSAVRSISSAMALPPPIAVLKRLVRR